MDFSLSEEQELLQETVRGWVEKECPPPVVREVFDADGAGWERLWQSLVEMGLAGLLVPESQGGAGLELLDLAVVGEVLGRGAVPGPLLGHSLACLALARAGSPEQQARWLPKLAAGEVLGTVALGQGEGRWDPETWSLPLAGGRLSGAMDWVPAGGDAGLLVVGVAGGGLALVDASEGGLRAEPRDGLDRTRPLHRVVFEGARAEPLAGDAAGPLRDAALVLLAADAYGAGHRLVRMSCEYALTREQFGQPIAQFQAVKHQLADMALAIDPTCSLWWFAAHAFDHAPGESERVAALAKAHITDRAMQVARDAVEVHGGLGFTWECDVQIWFKRVLFDRLFLGPPPAQRERIARLGGW